MKKLIVAVLILAMLLPAAGQADRRNVQKWQKKLLTYDSEELVDINAALQYVLFMDKAALNGVPVITGVYTVGEDIPAGSYRIEFPEAKEDTFGTLLVYYPNKETYKWYNIGPAFNVTSIGKITLEEEMIVDISAITAVFYTYTGIIH